MGEIRFIFCAGMARSGSTLQYQFVKSLVERAGMGRGIGFVSALAGYDPADGIAVVKSEPCEPWMSYMVRAGLAKAVTIHRNLLDVAVSLTEFRMKREGHIKHGLVFNDMFSRVVTDELISVVQRFTLWRSLPGIYVSSYEERHPDNWEREVADLARYLKISVTEKVIEQITECYSLDNNRQRVESLGDRRIICDETLLTNVHISDYERTLSTAQIAMVEAING